MKKVILFFIILSSLILSQSDTSLVFLGDIDSTIITDVKYATNDNFTGKILYPSAKVYLRKIVADSLAAAQKFLRNLNLKLKVYDGYRPLTVQKLMWSILPDEKYVADPKKGSRHNRGAAVDLTLIDSLDNELNMGTTYDDFSEKAGRVYKQLPKEVLKNRRLLEEVMIKFGFIPFPSEWWHYDFKGWERFSILDLQIK